MWIYYFLACIPPVIGAFLWVKSKKIVWWEWLATSVLGFITVAIIHVFTMYGMTSDTEIWSGEIQRVVFHPRWIEEYQQMHTRTTGSGKNMTTTTYFTTEHRTHSECWEAHLNFGALTEQKNISQGFYNEVVKNFGGEVKPQAGHRPGFDGGDRNDYHTINKTGYIYPTTTIQRFENRVKCAPSVFSFQKVSEDTPVFKYPQNENWRVSGRVLGTASNTITTLEWDRLNSKLGPLVKVNLVIIGFGNKGSEIAHLQEAKWIGGKKNDLVLCFGGSSEKPTWSYVFGWTEKAIVKRNLESILLQNPINNDILPLIETEVMANYEIKDWSKFDYITVQPPWWGWIVVLVVMGISQGLFMWWASENKFDEADVKSSCFTWD